MKTLLVLRHAKSSWSDPMRSDHDRPLNQRGKQAASRMGTLLLDKDLVPDLIISSTAKRAHSTAKRVAKACGYGGETRLEDELYLNGMPSYRTVLCQVPDHYERVMVIGHNPDMEALIEALTGRYERMPTAALAQVTLPIDRWRSLQFNGRQTLVQLWRPKELD